MIEELETFLAVAEYRNFTRAAQKRNISQPTASVQIKKLEEFFGASLIERTAKHNPSRSRFQRGLSHGNTDGTDVGADYCRRCTN